MSTAAITPSASDELIPLRKLADIFGLPYTTVFRWCSTGVDGMKLKTFRRGRRLYARVSWLAEFQAQLNNR